jgi:hypothetical protein
MRKVRLKWEPSRKERAKKKKPSFFKNPVFNYHYSEEASFV